MLSMNMTVIKGSMTSSYILEYSLFVLLVFHDFNQIQPAYNTILSMYDFIHKSNLQYAYHEKP